MNEQLEQANEKMKQSESFRIKLLANISHELGTPMTAIKGYAKALKDGIITANAPKYAERIYERSALLQRLIEDLLELTKLETRQIEFQIKDVLIIPYIEQFYLKYEWEANAKQIQFLLDLPVMSDETELVIAHIDPLRMEQVLANLLSNALKFTPANGVIRIALDINALKHLIPVRPLFI
ncbi:sensor histidine kinase [Paenibacillus sp. GCM10012307]|uniref:sensor histidine kinase n=1 Tax=Paenibacillus sp. GCM10012307 TaxID=3317343 RepID=UPI00362201F9